jgi:hypothetical protein
MRILGKPLADMKLKFDSILEEIAEYEIDFLLEENTDENEVVLLLTKKLNTDEKVI